MFPIYLLQTVFLLQVHNGFILFIPSQQKLLKWCRSDSCFRNDFRRYDPQCEVLHTHITFGMPIKPCPKQTYLIFERSYPDCQGATCKLNPFMYLWPFRVQSRPGYWMLRRIVRKQAFNSEISCKNESLFRLCSLGFLRGF